MRLTKINEPQDVQRENSASEGSPGILDETDPSSPQEKNEEAEEVADTTFKQPKSKRQRKSKSSSANSVHADVESSSQVDASSSNGTVGKSSSVSSSVVGMDEASGSASENAKKSGKNRKGNRKGEIAVQQFIDNYLPALRKEMSQQKKREQFKLTDYAECFAPNSKVRPTYILPLLHFIGSNSITCNRFGKFDGKCMVKTSDGFNHCMLLNRFSSENHIKEEELSFIMKRFGKEWHKIPAKDEVRVSMAIRAGHMGHFKITLTGVYEDSFYNDQGEEISTLNPILSYEGVRVKEQDAAVSSSSSSTAEQPATKKRKKTPALDPQDVLSGPVVSSSV